MKKISSILPLLIGAVFLLTGCKNDEPLPLVGSLVDAWSLLSVEEGAEVTPYTPSFNRMEINNRLRYDLLDGNDAVSEGNVAVVYSDTARLIFFTPQFGAPNTFEADAKEIVLPVGDTLVLEDEGGLRYRYTFIRE